MAKKSKSKSLNKYKKIAKGYKGLKKYVVIGLLGMIVIGVLIFWSAWNNAAQRVYDPSISVMTLPDTGMDISYYTNCIIDKRDGIGNYPDRATIKCTYLGPQVDGYDYETSQAYLKCEANNALEMNVCTEGNVK